MNGNTVPEPASVAVAEAMPLRNAGDFNLADFILPRRQAANKAFEKSVKIMDRVQAKKTSVYHLINFS